MASDAAGEAPGRSALTIERDYDAPPQAVWQAWTDPQALSKWFGPEQTEAVVLAETDVEAGVEPAPLLPHEDRSAGHDIAVMTLHAQALRVAVAAVT